MSTEAERAPRAAVHARAGFVDFRRYANANRHNRRASAGKTGRSSMRHAPVTMTPRIWALLVVRRTESGDQYWAWMRLFQRCVLQNAEPQAADDSTFTDPRGSPPTQSEFTLAIVTSPIAPAAPPRILATV
jgi:hypothetical protein